MLLVIFGPPAVGKMAVGRALAAGGEWRLFHNHASVELLLPVFDYGSPPFVTLDVEIRRRVIQEAAAASTRLVFTYVWSLDDPADRDYIEALIAPYPAAGLPVAFVELAADLDTRLTRNRTPERLAAKPSKRDIDWSDANLRELEQYVLNRPADRQSAADGLLDRYPGIRIDTVGLSADATAARIRDWLAVVGDVRH